MMEHLKEAFCWVKGTTMMTDEIDINKQYRTKRGREVKIYATDCGGSHPIHGAILKNGEWHVVCWTKKGLLYNEMVSTDDLVEVKPRIKRTHWLNIYPEGGSCDFLHYSKNEADENAGNYRIACVKVEIDCEEGEGL